MKKRNLLITGITAVLILSGCGTMAMSKNHSQKSRETKRISQKYQNQSSDTGASNSVDSTVNSQNNNANIQYYFPRANGQPEKQLISVINNSKSTLDIAIYSLTKKDIVEAIVNAKRRGVNVRLMTDKVEASSKLESGELNQLKNLGVPIKINSHKGLMHMKVTVADNSTVTTGSYNYTNNASYENDEVFVILKDSKAAQDFEKEFQNMWNDNVNYQNWN